MCLERKHGAGDPAPELLYPPSFAGRLVYDVYVPNRLLLHFISHDFSSGCGSFLALSAAGHAGGPRVRYGASVGLSAGPCGACSGRPRCPIYCIAAALLLDVTGIRIYPTCVRCMHHDRQGIKETTGTFSSSVHGT